jgi:hypothetical protein
MTLRQANRLCRDRSISTCPPDLAKHIAVKLRLNLSSDVLQVANRLFTISVFVECI